jgi:hypothetical protein
MNATILDPDLYAKAKAGQIYLPSEKRNEFDDDK